MSQEGILDVIDSHPSIPTTFVANSGSATPALNELNILGTGTITTSGSGNTITINGSAGTETLTGNSGGAVSPTLNNINTIGSGSITIVGNPGTSTLTTQLTGLTAHNVLVGTGTDTINNIPPSTAGFVLTSNGGAADPTFQAISLSGAITSITGNSGGAEVPTAGGNFNILGTGSITIAGSANTETVQLTGLTNHTVLVGAGTATITKVGPGSAGQVLQSGGAAADPVYSTATYPAVATGTGTILRADGTNWVATTATYPATTTVSQILYSSSTNVVGGLATANRAVLTTGATGIPVLTALATDGQLIIGSTAGVPAAAVLTPGTGISISNGSNSITISSTAGLTWSDKAASFNAAASNGYFVTANATATLPASPTNGDTISFFVDGAATLTIQANTGQTIQFSTNVSSSAGTQVNTASGDSATIVYRSTDTKWVALSFVGAWNKT